MDDNATCHRTLAVQDCLDSEGIQRLVWPARSPDLNPIENVWNALGRQVAGRNYPPTNKNTLIRALTEEWDKLPQQLLDNVVQNGVESETRYPPRVRPWARTHSLVKINTTETPNSHSVHQSWSKLILDNNSKRIDFMMSDVTFLLKASKTQVWRKLCPLAPVVLKQTVESKLKRHETRIVESKLYRLETKRVERDAL
ncbi:hypothetical protein TNCV_5016401 [Trichonephila clavipes]|nr:hypothetical protein TNCV_5016401 [Trichonephila clavipes]